MKLSIGGSIVEIEDRWSGLAAKLASDLQDHEIQTNPDLRISAGIPETAGDVIGDEAYLAGDTLVTKIGKEELGFSYKDSCLVIHIGPNVDSDWVLNNVLTPALYLIGLKKKVVLTHCCAVEMDGKGILICGPGGSSRTTLTLLFYENGARIISDDFTLLRPNGLAKRFCMNLTLDCVSEGFQVKDNSIFSPSARRHLPRADQCHALLKLIQRLYKFPPQRASFHLLRRIERIVELERSVPIEEIDPDSRQMATIDSIIFPILQQGISEPYLQKTSIDRASMKIILSTEPDFKLFLGRFILNQYAQPYASWIQDLVEARRRAQIIVKGAIKNASAYDLKLPKNWKKNQIVSQKIVSLFTDTR